MSEEKKNVNNEETSKIKKEKKDKVKKELEEKDAKIAELEEQLAMFKDKYYRAIADMDNQRKQYDKEYRQTLKFASQNLTEKLIPSFEMFAMVLESADKLAPEVQAYVQGFNMIYRQMVQALESEGISEISTKIGDKFDHTIHSGMETLEVDDPKLVDCVVKIIRKGYKIHDRLIKPVLVIVGKAKQEVKENKDNTQA